MANPPLGQQTLTLQQAIDHGVEHHSAGRLSEAESIYQQILQTDPNQPVALHMLGVIAHQVGKPDIAVDLITKALAVDTGIAAAHSNLGVALKRLGKLDEAVASYHKALAIQPEYVDAHYNLGVALRERGELNEAVESFRRAIKRNPKYADAYNGLSVALKDLGRRNEAVKNVHKALALNPNLVDAHNTMGVLNQDIMRFDEAATNFQTAIAIKPDFAEAHNNYGNVLRELNQLDAAIEAFDRAIALEPDYADAYCNKALALLLTGDFATGWSLYEWRRKRPALVKYIRLFRQPLWLGQESLAGKTVLLHREQGLGDAIQFCRYAKLVADLGASVVLEVDKSLVRLFTRLDGTSSIVANGSDLPPFDFHCPLMSLPLALKTRLDTIPNAAPYLSAEAQRVERWAGRIGEGGFKVGICWQGGTSGVDLGRSFPLTALREISEIPDVRLINLHKGDGLAQLDNLPSDMTVESLGADFDAGPDAFLDTAAVMVLCDLVITCDTVVAHLAGALGVPTWVALKQVPDWRWQLIGTDSPWYPSMALYRQPSAGDWQSVFKDMAAAIQAAAMVETD